MMQKTHVVIVGAGFGGLKAAQALAKAPVRITLVDRRNYHLFQPLLYQVATAELAPADIAYPIRKIFRGRPDFGFHLGEVQKVNLAEKKLYTDTGDLAYDYLILAAGGETNHFGMESVAKNSFGLKDIEDSIVVRNHLLRMFELAGREQDPEVRRALLTFVVAGGGPTGVESAGAISELVGLVLPPDYPHLDFSQVRIILLEAAGRLLAGIPDRLGDYTFRALQDKQVEVRLNTAVSEFNGEKIILKSGGEIATRTLIWAAGVRAAALANAVDSPKASLNRLVVTPALELPNHPEVFAIGDLAYFEQQGRPLPMVAPVAVQQASHAAQNIMRHLAGQDRLPFVYKTPGILATIGRNKAVAVMGRWQFSGFFAWVLWLNVHILRLIGFHNRLSVSFSWAWEYLFYDRVVRLMMPDIENLREKYVRKP
ncbi:NAD(P)/FAD-dependent oxidoreductase [Acetonema longum]|nr:NAD(P)/FAD-dependent oxidoreductase [Acetonema longum]